MSSLKFLKIITGLIKTIDELSKTNDIIFDIDWQGTKQLSKYKNLNLVKIFFFLLIKKNLKID